MRPLAGASAVQIRDKEPSVSCLELFVVTARGR